MPGRDRLGLTSVLTGRPRLMRWDVRFLVWTVFVKMGLAVFVGLAILIYVVVR